MKLLYLQEIVLKHQEEDTQRYSKETAGHVDKKVSNVQIAGKSQPTTANVWCFKDLLPQSV
jgi:hypothetical protein